MNFEDVTIEINDEVSGLMDERGIKESDVRELLAYAEGDGNKLYKDGENRFLGKKRIGNFTVYAEYGVNDNSIELFNVYSHRVILEADQA